MHVAHCDMLDGGILAENLILLHGDPAQVFVGEALVRAERVPHYRFQLERRIAAEDDRRLRNLFGSKRLDLFFGDKLLYHILALVLGGQFELDAGGKLPELRKDRFIGYDNEGRAAIGGKPDDADCLFDKRVVLRKPAHIAERVHRAALLFDLLRDVKQRVRNLFSRLLRADFFEASERGVVFY